MATIKVLEHYWRVLFNTEPIVSLMAMAAKTAEGKENVAELEAEVVEVNSGMC